MIKSLYKITLLILLIQLLTLNVFMLRALSKTHVIGLKSQINNTIKVGKELIIGVKQMGSEAYLKLLKLINNVGEVKDKVFFGSSLEALVVSIQNFSSNFIEKSLELHPTYIEPNIPYKVLMTPNDPYWSLQWGVTKIQAEYAWNITIGSPAILLAVVDTGIDWKHSDLAPNYIPLGYDWVNKDSDPMDDNGHGTHVAGIAASVINNHLGIAGISQVKMMAEKALNQSGYGYADDLAQAVIHATDQGAKIIVMSWGSNSSSTILERSIQYAYEKGVLLVAAAGNNAENIKVYPAAYNDVIAVSATNQLDKPASFTNYGDWIELSAPGVSIYSTLPNNNYGYMSGTSMSAPFVAGVAVLVWSANLNLTSNQVRMVLHWTADDLGSKGFDVYYGYGRVNAWKAVENVTNLKDIAVTAISPYKTIVGRGFTTTITVNVTNLGQLSESFNVSLYANSTMIQTANLTLNAKESTIIQFTWNTTEYAKGNYILMAFIPPLLGEYNKSNNLLYAANPIILTMPGDVNIDGICDMKDIGLVAKAFGTTKQSVRWNPIADINEDLKVDMKDLGLIAIHFGEKDP